VNKPTTIPKEGEGGAQKGDRGKDKLDNYAIREKYSTEENPGHREEISRDSYLIPFQWLDQ